MNNEDKDTFDMYSARSDGEQSKSVGANNRVRKKEVYRLKNEDSGDIMEFMRETRRGRVLCDPVL